MLIPLVNRAIYSDDRDTFKSDNSGTGHLPKVTKLKTLIQPVLIQLKNRPLHSDNGDNLSSDNGGTGHVYKLTSVS